MLPEGLVDVIYEYKHAMLYSKVMKQLKTCKVNTAFLVSLEFLEHGYFEFGSVRLPCIDINDIDSPPFEIFCVIYDKGNTRSNNWSRPYGGVL